MLVEREQKRFVDQTDLFDKPKVNACAFAMPNSNNGRETILRKCSLSSYNSQNISVGLYGR